MAVAEVGKRYRHYKNRKEYMVLSCAFHSETMEELVVYRAEYDTEDLGSKPVFARPRVMFEEKVQFKGEEVDRFELIA